MRLPFQQEWESGRIQGIAMENNNVRGRVKEFHRKLTGWLKSVVRSPPAVISILHEKP